MPHSLQLRVPTSSSWLDAVLNDFDAFLLDHAACERKASATAMNLVAHYRDRRALVDAMIHLAREELEHFQRVYRVIAARGLMLAPDRKDPYVRALVQHTRQGREPYFMDRLLIAGIVEARGAERFGLLAEHLEHVEPSSELAGLYRELSTSEAKHRGLFIGLAARYFEAGPLQARLDELLDREAAILRELPLRAALH